MIADWYEKRIRNQILASAAGTVVGLGLSLSEAQALGGWLTALSLIFLVWSLHRLGRTGPDAPP